MATPAPILYVSHVVEWGGAEVVLADLWSALDRERWQPHLACPGDGPLAARARELGVAVHRLAIGGSSPWRKALSVPAAALRLRRLARTLGARVLHANTMIAGYAAVLASRAGPPTLWHLHVAVGSTIARAALRRAAAVVTPSRAAAAHVPASVDAAGRLSVIQNGVPDRFFARRERGGLRRRLDLPPTARLCGIVGRLDPHKGHDQFLAAAARVVLRHQGVHFVIAGAAAFTDAQPRLRGYEAALRLQVTGLGLSGSVHFLGHVEDVAGLLAELDLVAVPSIAPEAAPRTIAEAMASGCPVVASRIGGIPEMIRHGEDGLLAPPGDVDQLSAAMLTLLADREPADRLAQRARSRATAEWSMARFAAGIDAVYRRIAP